MGGALQVFNVLFVKEQERRHVVHCIDCARRQAPRLEGFVVLEEYHLNDLCQVYDNFVLHSVRRNAQRCEEETVLSIEV